MRFLIYLIILKFCLGASEFTVLACLAQFDSENSSENDRPDRDLFSEASSDGVRSSHYQFYFFQKISKLFKIKDWCQKVRFQQTHNQGLLQLFLTVSWDLRAQRGTPDSVLVSLQFQKQRTRRDEGP